MSESVPKLVSHLKAVRADRRLTQQQLAQSAGISSITLSNIENGQHRPTKRTMAKIESVVGVVDWERTFSGGLIHAKTGEE